MANDKKAAFPLMPTTHWWTLRTKFQQSIPGVVTDSYVATVLSMQENSARANVLPYLKQVGIINDEGKPTDRAKKWRDNVQYRTVCKEIIKEVYPQELIDACPDPLSDRASAKRWFGMTGAGEVAIRRMTSFYSILSEADPSKAPESIKSKKVSKNSVKKKETIKKKETDKDQQIKNELPINGLNTGVTTSIPGININLQIHISADASPDQIDKIFESMAKHIYKRV